MQKLYIKTIDGTNHIESRSKIIVSANGRYIYNPSEELLLKNGWKEYNKNIGPDAEENDLQTLKDALKDTIIKYDLSSYINIFYINGDPLWLDKAARSNLIQRFNAEKYMGLKNTKLWYNNDEYSYEYILPIDIAINMLYELEVYAANCYDVTQTHLNNVEDLNDKESINNYDYYKGYPTPLQFNI